MAEESGIAWTKSTFNAWIGCTKVGPGCDHCYAEVMDRHRRWGGTTHWGAGQPRFRTSKANWAKPLKWNAEAPTTVFDDRPGFWPVFCSSLADVFDNEVDEQWRYDLWALIEATPNLTWQIVTKRIGNVMDMIPVKWRLALPNNVWIIATMVNQAEYDRDIGKLIDVPARIRGISMEPMLGPINMGPLANDVQWVIVGGESTQGGAKARMFDIAWARDILTQCRESRTAVFIKQLGSNPVITNSARAGMSMTVALPVTVKDRAGAEPDEWPLDLAVREFPRHYLIESPFEPTIHVF